MNKKEPGVIVGVTPATSQVLIEHLTAQEALGSRLTILDKSDVGAPQAYILAIGPGLESEKLGFKVGDRVIVQGKYVPIPKPRGQVRELGIINYTDIKAVLEEEKED